MKKILLLLAVGAAVCVTTIAQGAPPMVPPLKMSGFFLATAELAKSIDNGDMNTTSPFFLGIGGFSADLNGTGVNCKSAVFAGELPGIDPETFDLHTSFFNRAWYSALGSFDDDSFILRGPISVQDYITPTIGKAGGSAGAYYGWLNKINYEGISAGIFIPVSKASDSTTFQTTEAFKNAELAVSYALQNIGTVNAGWYGLTKNVFANFKLDDSLIQGVSGALGVNYNYTDNATKTTVGFSAGYSASSFNIVTEDKFIIDSSEANYDLKLRLNIPFEQIYTARLDLGYATTGYGQFSFVTFSAPDSGVTIHPQLLISTKLIPFAELNLGFKYSVDLDDATQTYWSIPITIDMLIL